MSYLHRTANRVTPQSEPMPGQVPNSAGGHGFAPDPLARLRRFLILGSEGGSYYASEGKLTRENLRCLDECVAAKPTETVDMIRTVSVEGRAPKQSPTLFALASCAASTSAVARSAALAAIPAVCRTASHLFEFLSYLAPMRGWSRSLRRAVGKWYDDREAGALAYQIVKYRTRTGWSHRDVLRLAHPKGHPTLYEFACGRSAHEAALAHPVIQGFVLAQTAGSPRATATLIRNYGLTREMVKPDHLTDPGVWGALLDKMPMTAMIRNLGNMSKCGLLVPMSKAAGVVASRLGDGDHIRKSRVHPIQILAALLTYRSGRGARGSGAWTPVGPVVDALDGAFYAAFGNVEPVGRPTLLALDVSGSMDGGTVAGVPGLTPRIASAALALVTAATEPQHEIVGFTNGPGRSHWSLYNGMGSGLVSIPISARQRLDDVVRTVSAIPMGGTDCVLPMVWAKKNRPQVESFAIYTDSETWAGDVHPHVALRDFRRETGHDARCAVVGMVSNGFTIADPTDPGMLDVVGFDTGTPALLSAFLRGEV